MMNGLHAFNFGGRGYRYRNAKVKAFYSVISAVAVSVLFFVDFYILTILALILAK